MEHPRSRSLSVSLRYWLVVAGLILPWVTAVGFVGPWTIRQLHAGHGPAFLVSVLGGRESTPVADYLLAWEQFARSASVLLILCVLGGYVAMRLFVATRRPPVPSSGAAAWEPEPGEALPALAEAGGKSDTAA